MSTISGEEFRELLVLKRNGATTEEIWNLILTSTTHFEAWIKHYPDFLSQEIWRFILNSDHQYHFWEWEKKQRIFEIDTTQCLWWNVLLYYPWRIRREAFWIFRKIGKQHPSQKVATSMWLYLFDFTRGHLLLEWEQRIKPETHKMDWPEILLSDFGGVLKKAILLLGKLKRKESIPFLVKALKHSKSWNRWHAAWALGESGLFARDIIPQLMLASKDPHWIVREKATEAIAFIQSEIQLIEDRKATLHLFGN